MATDMNTNVSDVEIRKARAEDCEDLIRLIQSLAEFSNHPDGVQINADILRTDGFGPDRLFHCFVAECEATSIQPKQIVGLALYYHSYSSRVGPSVYLDDLYVIPEFRHKGIGTRLLRAVAKTTVDRKGGKLVWAALGWNEKALEFYKSTGARNMTKEVDEHCLRLDGTELKTFASGEN